MTKTLNFQILIMLLLSTLVAYFTITSNNPGSAYSLGFMFGRALASTLAAVIIFLIPAGIYKLIKKEVLPGRNIWLWTFWFIIIAISTMGNKLG